MKPARPLPAGVRPLTGFARALHDHGFAVATEQTVAFLQAVSLLGPRSLGDIYQAARAMLAPPPERLDEFDALFDAFFRDGVAAIAEATGDGDETTAAESGSSELAPAEPERGTESGETATAAESLGPPLRGNGAKAAAPHRTAPAEPRSTAPARVPAHGGSADQPDLRRSITHDARRRRSGLDAKAEKQRRVLLLIDVSGSMKAHTTTPCASPMR